MQRVVLAGLVVVLAAGSGAAAGPSIGIFADSSATSCNIDASHPFHIWYIVAVNADAVGGFRGAEFAVDLDGGSYSMEPIITTSATQMTGDLFNTFFGVTWAWDTCQPGDTVIGSVRGTMTDVQDRTYRILAVYRGPLFPCPTFILCDDPIFTRYCVAAGEAFVNSQRECTVAVDDRTWSQVKGLYQE